jgi:hypothetical protein
MRVPLIPYWTFFRDRDVGELLCAFPSLIIRVSFDAQGLRVLFLAPLH